jgi:peroxiredoxin
MHILLAAALLAAQGQPKTLDTGASAPDFNLPGVDGKNHALKDFAEAKLLVVMFTCNHCPTAIAYEERIKRLVRDYAEKGVALVAISPNDPKSLQLDELGYTDLSDSLEEMKIRARDAAFNFPYLYDGNSQETSKAYGATSTPHAFLFDGDRKLRYTGRIDDNKQEDNVKVHDLRRAIDALLAGRDVPVARTRARGCSVKWAYKSGSVQKFMERVAAEPVTLTRTDPAALKALLGKDPGKVRLIHAWDASAKPDESCLDGLVTVNLMYRKRNFEFLTVTAAAPDQEKNVLAFLKAQRASNRNYVLDTSEDLAAWMKPWGEGGTPQTLVVAGDRVLFRHSGGLGDPLKLKRAILKGLNGKQK